MIRVTYEFFVLFLFLFIYLLFFIFSQIVFSVWSGNDTTMDIMVRQDAIPRVSRILREKNVRYDVVINDLQKAIDEENPPLSEELMEELEGRKGSIDLFFILFCSLSLLLAHCLSYSNKSHLLIDHSILLFFFFLFNVFCFTIID